MRSAKVSRNTLETRISVELNLDGSGKVKLDTGLPFLEHMLDQIARHGLLDLDIDAKGDLHIDAHHTVGRHRHYAGSGIQPGCWRQERPAPLRPRLRAAGRGNVACRAGYLRPPGLVFNVEFVRSNVGEFEVDLIREFFQGFVNHALVTLHIDNLAGDNAHHQAETIFKAFGRALRMALELDPRMAG